MKRLHQRVHRLAWLLLFPLLLIVALLFGRGAEHATPLKEPLQLRENETVAPRMSRELP